MHILDLLECYLVKYNTIQKAAAIIEDKCTVVQVLVQDEARIGSVFSYGNLQCVSGICCTISSERGK